MRHGNITILGRRAQRKRIGGRVRPRAAFTLVELLLGLLISTMILSSASALFVMSLNAWERGAKQTKTQRVGDAVTQLLERYLRSAVSPTTDARSIFWGTDLTVEDSPGHRVSFVSSAPGRLPRAYPSNEATEIEFEFDPSEDSEFSIRIDVSVDSYADEGGYRAGLSPWVKGFSVIYFDGEEWETEWLTNGLPKAVEIRLLIDDPDCEFPHPNCPAQVQVSRLISIPASGGGGWVDSEEWEPEEGAA